MATIDPNEALHILFDSPTRVKILKLLFRNFPKQFSIAEIAKMVDDTPERTRRELNRLIAIGLVRAKTVRVKNS